MNSGGQYPFFDDVFLILAFYLYYCSFNVFNLLLRLTQIFLKEFADY